MRLTERLLDGANFKRRKATADTKRKIVGWEKWECADPSFTNTYDRTVTMYVHEGAAVLTFADGETADIEAGDTLTVNGGSEVTWEIMLPVRNSYQYHDTFVSAENRAYFVRWQST